MRWLKAVMQLIGKMVCPSTIPSVLQEQPLNTAKRSRAKSGQPSKDAQGLNQSVKPKPKRKSSAVQSTTAAKSRKSKQKPVQPAAKASGATGSQPRTRARQTRQHAK